MNEFPHTWLNRIEARVWAWIANRLTRSELPGASRVRYIFKPLAGVPVNEDEALRYSALWSCVRAIAEPIATFPWRVMVRQDNRREPMEAHPADWLLNVQPNPEMTACTFRETIVGHVLTWGNGYAEIERDGSGRPVWLWLIEPDRVRTDRDTAGALWYEVNNSRTGKSILPARDIFHLKGIGFDGVVGYSPVQMAKESISLGLACERFGAAFFGNGAMPGGVIEAPPEAILSVDARKTLIDQFNAVHRGPANSGKTAFLDGGMTFKSLSIPPETAQFLQSRKFQIAEIARWYRVPLHKLYELDRATYNNIETQQIEFLTETLVPWMARLEQEANAKLIGPYQRGRVYTKLRPEALLRGDIKTRYEAYAIGRQWGWLSINDVRALEDLNPIPNGGDEYLTPLNMREAGSELPDGTNPPTEPEPPAPNSPPDAIEDMLVRILQASRADSMPTINLHMPDAAPINVHPAMHIHEGTIDVRVDGGATTVHPAAITVHPPVVAIEAAPVPDITVNVAPAKVEPIIQVAPAAAQITLEAPGLPDIVIHNEQPPPVVDVRPNIQVAPSPAPDVHVINEAPIVKIVPPAAGDTR